MDWTASGSLAKRTGCGPRQGNSAHMIVLTGNVCRWIVEQESAASRGSFFRRLAGLGKLWRTSLSPFLSLDCRHQRNEAPKSLSVDFADSSIFRTLAFSSSFESASKALTVSWANRSSRSSHFEVKAFVRKSMSSGLTSYLNLNRLSCGMSNTSFAQKSASSDAPSRANLKPSAACPSALTCSRKWACVWAESLGVEAWILYSEFFRISQPVSDLKQNKMLILLFCHCCGVQTFYGLWNTKIIQKHNLCMFFKLIYIFRYETCQK